MWEVLTLARELPLGTLNEAEVFENLLCYYDRFAGSDNNNAAMSSQPHRDGMTAPRRTGIVCPLQPQHCPRELYDLMRECWNGDELARPTFGEIYAFLKRKNVGYRPPPPSLAQPTELNFCQRRVESIRTSVLVWIDADIGMIGLIFLFVRNQCVFQG